MQPMQQILADERTEPLRNAIKIIKKVALKCVVFCIDK
jgi:hypothetical protein